MRFLETCTGIPTGIPTRPGALFRVPPISGDLMIHDLGEYPKIFKTCKLRKIKSVFSPLPRF
eukprot:1352881-Amorphochlora_amoeboformis.AAC.2